jgi:NAD(P)-dependent dehydrogenase (short-subunit alcohol dehydrogenase family)
MDFKGKQVAITGGTGEIGLVIARRFVERGAWVTFDRALSEAESVAVGNKGMQFSELEVTDRLEASRR